MIVIIGGFTYSGPTDKNEAYRFSTNSWTSRRVKKTNSGGIGGLSFTSDIGVCSGGNTGGNSVSLKVQGYTYSSDFWVNKKDLPYALDDAQEISLTTDIGIIAGGRVGTTYPFGVTNRSLLYSLSTNTWTEMATISISRNEMGSFSLSKNNGLIYGGVDSTTVQNRSEKYTYGIPSFLGFSVLTW